MQRIGRTRQNKRAWVLAATLLVMAALGVFYFLGLTSVAGQVHDDVVYLVTGKAMAENLGYRIISQPGAPFQIGYPPLYPALLALVWKVFPAFPANLWAFKSLNIACALASLPLTYWLVVKAYGAPRWQGWVTAGLLAVSSFYFTFMDLTMSEPLFLLVLLAALIVLERLPQARWAGGRWAPLAIACVAALPFLTRTIGITLLAAVVVWLLVGRKFKLAVASGAAMAAAVVPWVLWGWWAKRQADTSWDYVSWVGDKTGGYGSAAFFENLVHNGTTIVTSSIPTVVTPLLQHETLVGLVGRVGLAGLLPLAAVGVTGLVLLGLLRLAVGQLRLLHVFLAAYVGLILVYPWDPSRFMIALAPLWIFAFVQGASWLAETRLVMLPAWGRAIAWGLVGVAVATSAGAGAARVASFAKNQAFNDALLPAVVKTQQADEKALVAWAEAHMPQDGVWVHRRDPLLYLLTGREALSYADGPNPAPARKALFTKRPAFMVVYPEPHEAFTTHQALVKAHPDKAKVVFEPPGKTFKVYRLSQNWN